MEAPFPNINEGTVIAVTQLMHSPGYFPPYAVRMLVTHSAGCRVFTKVILWPSLAIVKAAIISIQEQFLEEENEHLDLMVTDNSPIFYLHQFTTFLQERGIHLRLRADAA